MSAGIVDIMIDAIRVASQLKQKLSSFIRYQGLVEKTRSQLEDKLPQLQEYLDGDPSLSADKWEDIPGNQIYYSMNRVFKDLVSLKEWSGKVLADSIVIGVDGSQINFDHHVSPLIAMVQSGLRL